MNRLITQTARIRSAKAGFSTLEVMIVLAIIALTVGLVAPRVMDNFGRAKSQVAKIQLNNIRGALQLYYLDVGRYPTEAEGLGVLLHPPPNSSGWNGPYLDKAEDINDPWGRVIYYRSPGQEGAFDLFSYRRECHRGGSREARDLHL